MKLRAPTGRVTNLLLLAALLLAFATGTGAVATGSARGRWIVVAHGVAAMLVILLIPWKSRVVRAGLRHHPVSRWVSLLLAALAVAALVFGLGYSTGLVRSYGGIAGMWLHVAAALALVPLAVWHVLRRPARPRRTDVNRRVLLRAGLLAVAAGGVYAATTGVVSAAGLPGTRRRFTGSYEVDPAAMPNTIWLDDTVPDVDPDRWRLTVVDAAGRREWRLADLPEGNRTVRATLDCTSGWYAHQDWTGVPVRDLVRATDDNRSLLVHSVTGYWIRLPLADLDSLLLATAMGGEALSPGHGYPARLVAPGRRGYWWVKWVDRIEVSDAPWWWQPPFPVT